MTRRHAFLAALVGGGSLGVDVTRSRTLAHVAPPGPRLAKWYRDGQGLKAEVLSVDAAYEGPPAVERRFERLPTWPPFSERKGRGAFPRGRVGARAETPKDSRYPRDVKGPAKSQRLSFQSSRGRGGEDERSKNRAFRTTSIRASPGEGFE